MQRVEVKEMVARAVGGQWDEFAKKHPHLAAAIDRQLLVERTLEELHASEEFAQAMRQVDAGAAEGSVLEEIIGRVAKVILLAL